MESRGTMPTGEPLSKTEYLAFFRKFCGLRKASTFSDLRDVMNADAVAALETAYRHVDDIDLFPGIMSESPTRGCYLVLYALINGFLKVP